MSADSNGRYKISLRFTVINLTNKEAVYNFLSTRSGTHYVTPRTETVEVGPAAAFAKAAAAR